METSPTHCLNCQAELSGPFCGACGQRVQALRLSFRGFLSDWFREAFEADGRLARTLYPMFLRPGFLTREYLEGRRVSYTSPLKLFVFSAVLSFLSLKLLFKGAIELNINSEAGTHGEGFFADQMDVLSRLGHEEMVNRIESGFFETAPTVLALLLPFVALLLKALYWRRLYVEHLVFALHQHAVVLLLVTPLMLTRSPLVAIGGVVLASIHFLFAMRTAYQRPWFGTIATWLVAMTAYFFLITGGMVVTLLVAIATI